MSSAHTPGRSTIRDYTYWPTYRRAAQRVRLTSNAHNPRLGQHTSSAHSPGRSTIRDYTYWPTYRRAEQRVCLTSNAYNSRLGQHTSSAHSPGKSTIRDNTYWPTYRGQHNGFDLGRTHTTLGSDSTCRAHIVPEGAQSGTTHIGPRTAG